MKPEVQEYTFEVTLAGVEEVTPEMAEAVYALCDDAFVASSGGIVRVGFDREAESLGDAIGSAVRDIERAGYTVARIEIEPGDD